MVFGGHGGSTGKCYFGWHGWIFRWVLLTRIRPPVALTTYGGGEKGRILTNPWGKTRQDQQQGMVRRSERQKVVNAIEKYKKALLFQQKYCSAERDLRDVLVALWDQKHLDVEDGVIEVIVEKLGTQLVYQFDEDEDEEDEEEGVFTRQWLTKKRGFSLAYAE